MCLLKKIIKGVSFTYKKTVKLLSNLELKKGMVNMSINQGHIQHGKQTRFMQNKSG